MSPDEEVRATLLIQKTIRGVAARLAHKISKLKSGDATDYVPFMLGNDHALTEDKYAHHLIRTNFVLVGTALFRSVDIACRMAVDFEGRKVFAKVIIVDNSEKVVESWRRIKTAFASSAEGESWDSFLKRGDGLLELFLELSAEELCRFDSTSNPARYFSEFKRRFELEYVKRIVAGVVVIQQSWGDVDTFKKIARIHADRPIVAYPSNIVECVAPEMQIEVLRCIEILKPVVSLWAPSSCVNKCQNWVTKVDMPNFRHTLPV